MNQLTKSSSSEEIKIYFNAILKLTKASEEFPVNLDEVWMLVYPRKDHAVRDLTDNFIEGVDYQVFLKKGDNPQGGRPTNEYFLTVSCLEYFIVKKVRPVFEVYRKIFHKASEHARQLKSPTPTKVKASIEWVKGIKELLNLNDSSVLSLVSQVAEPFGLPTPDYTPSKGILKSAGKI